MSFRRRFAIHTTTLFVVFTILSLIWHDNTIFWFLFCLDASWLLFWTGKIEMPKFLGVWGLFVYLSCLPRLFGWITLSKEWVILIAFLAIWQLVGMCWLGFSNEPIRLRERKKQNVE